MDGDALTYTWEAAGGAFELAAVAVGVGVVTVISLDGKSDWLGGARLLAAYGILTAALFFF